MRNEQINLLKKLTEANGIPGQEEEVRKIMQSELENNSESTDVHISTDNLGSLIAKKGVKLNNRPRIMISSHMDEVGFIVKKIDENGFIKFHNLGGWWSHSLLSQEVYVINSKGKKITGVIGSKPPHLLENEEKNKVVKLKNMFIDIGASSKEEVHESGIELGDMIVPKLHFEVLYNKNYLKSKAFDNRVGCATALEVFKNIDNNTFELCIAGTVQEEVGLRGSSTATYKINPDIAINVDVTLAKDTPNISENENKLGNGPIIVFMDVTHLADKRLKDLAIKTAKELDLNVNLEINEKGGTDAGRIHMNNEGVPTIGFSIPGRYIHTHSSIINYNDYNQLVELVTKFTEKLGRNEY